MKILVIEDVFLARQSLKQTLQKEGSSVDEAQRASSAIALLKKNEYNYILLDLGLPDMDGIELIKKIREMGCNSKIIITTGNCSKDTLFRCINAGADHYLIKPIDFERLKEVVFDF